MLCEDVPHENARDSEASRGERNQYRAADQPRQHRANARGLRGFADALPDINLLQVPASKKYMKTKNYVFLYHRKRSKIKRLKPRFHR